jgi:CheY-like chemotaxis protein
MTGMHTMTSSARQLARNPLGVIALFIVLIYGLASSVVGLSSLQPSERMPIVWFLVIFPVLVLGVFGWLVSRHHAKLYSPADYRQDSSFIEASVKQLEVAAALGAATARRFDAGAGADESALQARTTANRIARLVTPATLLSTRARRLLWVDDHLDASVFEREALQALGFEVVVARSTQEAIAAVDQEAFDVVVSDICRPPDLRAGFTLLTRLRNQNLATPYILYSRAVTPDQQTEAWKRGALGIVNRPGDLVALIIEATASVATAA